MTDIIVNTAGGLIGLGLFALLRPKPRALAWMLGGGTAFAVAAIVVVITSFPRIPHDGGVFIQSFVTF